MTPLCVLSVAFEIYPLIKTGALWQQPREWGRLQRNAMRADFGWAPAAEYAALYHSLRRF